METTRIDLPLVLPDVPDAQDACVSRLIALLAPAKGIAKAHTRTRNGKTEFCLHYDPALVTGDEVRRLATAAGAHVHARYGHYVVPLRAIAGEEAGRGIEARLGALPGVLGVSANLASQLLRVEFDREQIDERAIDAEVEKLGFTGQSPIATTGQPPKPWYRRNRELFYSLVSGALLTVALVGERFLGTPDDRFVLVYLAAYVFGSYDLLGHALKSVRSGRVVFDIDLLMLLAAIGAAALGEWAEGAFLLFLFYLAHAMEHVALGRARASIRALADLAPPIARVQRGQTVVEVPVGELKVGEVVLVRPADRIPVDGRIRTGQSAINQAPITGESVPVDKREGDEVFAGTINGEGVLTIETVRAAGDRTIDRVMQLVEEAQTAKAPTQLFTERFEHIFVPTVLIADVVLMVLPTLLGLWPWSVSFYRAMALLVAASPCALALGTPATVLAGIAQAARRGVLVKGGMRESWNGPCLGSRQDRDPDRRHTRGHGHRANGGHQ